MKRLVLLGAVLAVLVGAPAARRRSAVRLLR